MQLTFRMDMSELIAFNRHIEQELRAAIRSGVNSAAVIGKRAFIKAAVPDIAGERVSAADVRKQITSTRAGDNNLTHYLTVKNTGFKRTPSIIALLRGNQYKKGGGTVRTFALTGGGSNPLRSDKLFQISKNGGRAVMVWDKSRPGKTIKTGKRAGKTSYAKSIYAEGPGTAMGQARSVPRTRFEVVTAAALEQEVSTRVQAVLNGGSGSGNEASDT